MPGRSNEFDAGRKVVPNTAAAETNESEDTAEITPKLTTGK